MSIITLTTDFGIKDYFVGALKGAILSELPLVNIVEISHEISPFNIPETAYIINNTYSYFPDNTVHIIGVDAEWNPTNKHVVVQLKNQYFICADNGILSLLLKNNIPTQQYEIVISEQQKSIFPVLDIFVKVAIHIVNGGNLEAIGKPIYQLNILAQTEANIKENGNQIIGSVIYIDHFGNVVFNISKKQFDTVCKGRKYKISAGSHKYKIEAIFEKYGDVVLHNELHVKKQLTDEGTALAVFNSAGFFQVSIYKSNLKSVGGASSLLGLKYGSSLIIDFI
ncbi:MAG: SAM-dependent chlorinase/fluorinase [Flavobacteriaceae bacterium]|jgi:S-adenosylmethionine hydrolase|nr:SAM-dependent chlorinase/fluorinase [Flavobacteriaceae bacterium]